MLRKVIHIKNVGKVGVWSPVWSVTMGTLAARSVQVSHIVLPLSAMVVVSLVLCSCDQNAPSATGTTSRAASDSLAESTPPVLSERGDLAKYIGQRVSFEGRVSCGKGLTMIIGEREDIRIKLVSFVSAKYCDRVVRVVGMLGHEELQIDNERSPDAGSPFETPQTRGGGDGITVESYWTMDDVDIVVAGDE